MDLLAEQAHGGESKHLDAHSASSQAQQRASSEMDQESLVYVRKPSYLLL